MPFDASEWWKVNNLKYRILSTMERDILAISITTVALESTFSAGNRVIDTYHSSLSLETIQVLLCGGDWCCSFHGLKKKNKVNFPFYFSFFSLRVQYLIYLKYYQHIL